MNEVFIVAWLVTTSLAKDLKVDQAGANSLGQACRIMRVHHADAPKAYLIETFCTDIYCTDHKTVMQPIRLWCGHFGDNK